MNIDKPKVSVIIPSYNRFNYLLNAINSVKNQSYKNLEIIVINDGSEQKEYYDYNFDDNIKIVHLKENQKKIHGFGPGSIRNFGVSEASGDYLAFLDDDDIWLKNKIELQIKQMQDNKVKMSSTEGFFGFGTYNKNNKYPLYNKEHYFKDLKYIYRKTKYITKGKLPNIWNYDFINIHNCFITSSVIVDKEIFDTMGGFRNLPLWADYDCWLGLLRFTDSIYLDEPLFYYDAGHGDGRNYKK